MKQFPVAGRISGDTNVLSYCLPEFQAQGTHMENSFPALLVPHIALKNTVSVTSLFAFYKETKASLSSGSHLHVCRCMHMPAYYSP